MSGAQKKVVVRLLGGELAWGYLPGGGFRVEGQVALMALDGRVTPIAFNEIETIAYVRDFNLDDRVDPERLGRRSFAARPREEGLWVRVGFRELASVEGLVGVDLGFLDALSEDQGVFLTPPDGRGNTLRLFVPRPAMRSLEVLGLVTAPSKRRAAKAETRRTLELQAGLFEE
jgi:hypothetical protein